MQGLSARGWQRSTFQRAGGQRSLRVAHRRVFPRCFRCKAGEENRGWEGASDLDASAKDPGLRTLQSLAGSLGSMDTNQLQTALASAIAAEDYSLAAAVRDQLQRAMAEKTGGDQLQRVLDWKALGIPGWLADRAERLSLKFPTEVQQRAAPVLLSGCDAVIQSETGSGKTAAFLMPALARLDYPPELFPDDLDGPQLLVLVPTFELGAQVALLLYKLYGGNISCRTPGDPANMFTYEGPRGIRVRGLLTDEELYTAGSQPRFLAGTHVVVATPDRALAAHKMPGMPLCFSDLRAVVVDEVDAILAANPASYVEVMQAACARARPPQEDAAADGPAAGGLGFPGPGQGLGVMRGADAVDQIKALKRFAEQRQEEGPGAGEVGPSQSPSSQQQGQQLEEGGRERAADQPSAAAAAGACSSSQEQEQQQQQADGVGPGTSQQGGQQQDCSSTPSSMDDMMGGMVPASGMLPQPSPEQNPDAKPQVVLVGATVTDAEVDVAVNAGWLEEPVMVQVGQACRVPSGLVHRALVVSEARLKLAVMVRQLRDDLQGGRPGGAPVRVIVFAEDEAAAKAAADPLRSALWNEHMLSVLLPSGAEPIKALHAFRDRAASLLLATPGASRGLDLPAVSHVYNSAVPEDSREYLHRAGRAGRIGSMTGGVVTTLVTPEELPRLQELAGDLGVELEVVDELAAAAEGVGLLGRDWLDLRKVFVAGDGEVAAAGGDAAGQDGNKEEQLESARKGLEDLFNLF